MKIKFNRAFLILLLYSLFLMVFSTEIIIREYLNTRRTMLIESPDQHNVKTLLLSKKFWNNLKNKKEFTANNTFYDLISFEEKNDKIVARVIKDNFEIVLKKTAQNLLKKNSKNKKNYTSISITTVLNEEFKMDLICLFNSRKKINCASLNLEDNYSHTIFQPPCFIPIA